MGTFMNESTNSIEIASLSEDQRAIVDYFASDAYLRASSHPRRPARRRRRKWPDRQLSPTTSFVMGLAGLSGMLLFFGSAAPLLAGALYEGMDASNYYIAFTMFELTIILPAIIVFAFVAVTPMFWYGSVLLRFTLAAILMLPGCFVFLDGFRSQTSRLNPIVALATFLIIAAVAVLIQMWSRWTLSHSRQIDARLAPTGTRSIMELTVVTAIGCFSLLGGDTSDYLDEMLVSMGIGFCTAVAVIAVLVAFLRPGRRNLFAASIAALFAFAGSFILSGTRAFAAFGWGQLPSMLPSLIALSFYGLILFFTIMWLCIGWLRVCGWICLNREEEKQVLANESREDWPQRLFSEQSTGPLR
jgi:hypothetical protein